MSIDLSAVRRFAGRLLQSFTSAAAIGVLAGLSASPGALAVDTTWDAGTGDWATGSNWDTDNTPTSADDAIINNGGTAQVLNSGNEAANVSVGIGGGTGTLEITETGTLAAGVVGLALSSGSGVLRLQGSGGNQGVLETSQILSGGGGSGTLSFEGGILRATASQSVMFQGFADGDVTLTGDAYIDTQGFLVMTAAGIGGSGDLFKQGSGFLFLTGTNDYDGWTRIHEGELRVDGGSITMIAGDMVVAEDDTQTAALIISNGGTVDGLRGILGRFDGSNGDATVNGTGSTWTSSDELRVGDGGIGSLTIEDGGTVENVDGYIGRDFTGFGGVTVTGSGSTWTNSGDLFVGDGGGGSLIIEDGGEVMATTVTVGNNFGDLDLNGTAGSRGFIETAQITEGIGNGTIDFDGGGVRVTGDVTLFSDFETGDVTFDAGGGTIDTQAFDVTVSMVLDGLGGLTKEGTGTLTLSGANTFTGGITVDDGTLTRSVAGGFVSTTAYTVNGGTLDLNNIALIASSLSGTGGTVSMGSATLTVNQSGNTTYAGAVTGTGGLTKVGAGTLSLSGDSTFTGNATVIAGTLEVDGGSFTQGAGDMRVGLGNGDNGTLIIENGGTITNDLGRVGEASGSTGSVTVDGTGSLWDNAGTLFVGNGGTGEMTISDGGEVESTEGRLGDAATGSGEATVTGTDSLWEMTSFLLVGNNGAGTLTIGDGGTVEADSGRIGDGASGSGEATITGTDSLWQMSTSLFVGDNGTGTLLIEDGGTVTNTFSRVGEIAGSSGEVTVTGAGSFWDNSSTLFIGNGGTGEMTISDGGEVENTEGRLGDGTTGVGDATVTGADSLWEMSSFLRVGGNGAATLIVEDGGEVRSTEGHIGNAAIGQGEVTVTGADSLWNMSSFLLVGNNGTGTLIVEDGGEVRSTTGGLGNVAASNGEATVTGADSLWQMSSFLQVGNNGTGTLTVEDGGEVLALNADIGQAATGVGEATISGTGSRLSTTTDIVIGNFGTGTLTVEDGGTVENTFSRVGEQAGSDGEVVVTGAGSLWSSSSDQYVGNSGSGTLTIEDGGSVEITSGRIGDKATGVGEVTVTGTGSLWDLSSFLIVGNLGTGTLVIENGGEVRSTDNGVIAAGATGVGEVTVSGTGSLWDMAEIRVGETATGTLTVEDGGQVTALTLILGLDAGSSGAVLVDGATLETAQVERGAGTGTIDFDDAVLILTDNQSGLFDGFAAGDITINAGGAVIDTQAFEASALAGFDGAGALTKLGSGTLNLSATGTYSGGTLIDEGTLGISDGDELGSGTVTLDDSTLAFNAATSTLANDIDVDSGGGTLLDNGFGNQIVTGEVTLNGDLLLDGANVIQLDGDISGTGELTAGMSNGAIITGDATHTGGTTISSGILQIGAGGTTGSVGGDIVNNGELSFSRSDSVTHAGDISGTGTLSKFAAGTLTLTGDHTYAGDTFIQGGTLVFAGDTSGLGGDIVNDANLVFDQAADSSFGGEISSTGTLLKTGSGALTLGGDNSYSGATGVGDGTLVFDGGTNTIGTITAAGGDLVIQNGATVSNDTGFIGRTGIASATATVTGAGSTWTTTGDLQVSEIIPMPLGGIGGTLRVENGAQVNVGGELFVDVFGVLEIDSSSQVTAADDLRLKAGTVRLLGGGALNIPDIVIDGVAGVIDTNGFDSSYAGTIATSGTLQVFSKTGAGKLTLTGNHADAELQAFVDVGTLEIAGTFAGDASVDVSSTLIVNGSLAGSTLVSAGGTLGGSGSVGSIDIDGIVAPGNSIGTLTVNGNADFSDGGIYEVEVNAAGESDLLDVAGTATLTGGSVQLVAEDGDYDPLTTYLILTADGGINGEFDSLDSDFTFLTPQLNYDANSVFLNLVRSDVEFLAVAETWNQRAVAGALDTVGPTPGGDFQDLMNALLTLSPEEARFAFDRLSGVQHTHGLYVARQAARGLHRLSFGRLGGGGRNPGLSGLTLAFSDQPWAQQLGNQWLAMLDGAGEQMQNRGLWVRGYGVWGDIESDDNAAGADYDTAGLAVGLDAEFGEAWTAGVAAGYGSTDTDSFDGELDGDTYQVAAYAGFRQDAWYGQGLIGHAWHDVESTRPVSFSGFDSVSDADYDMTTFSAALEVGYDFAFSEPGTVTPFIAFDYAHSHRDSYTESGPAGLAVDGETAESLRPTLGLRLSYTLTTDTGSKLEPVVYAAYAHEVLDTVSRVQGTFATTATDGFIIDGPETDRGRFLAGAALNTALTQRAALTLSWDVELADSDTAHALSATFRYRW